jgi:uncharacterized protein
MTNTTILTPTAGTERITIMDSLRGIAILGILLMNIPGFALPEPLCYGDLSLLGEGSSGLNFKAWYGISLTVEGTQRALFSMLFGAGIILFIARKEKNASGLAPADYFFRRQLWLLLFGLFNAFVLLWFWDILFQYAIAGMILFAFRGLSVKHLIVASVLCLCFQLARDNVDLYRDKKVIATGEMLSQKDTSVVKLTALETDKMGAWTAMKEKSSKAGKQKLMEKSLEKVRGDYATFYEYQSERSLRNELFFTYNGIWDILIFMFLGMALFKSGFLLGQANIKWYWGMCIVGLGGGMLLTWYVLQQIVHVNFSKYDYVKQVPVELYELLRSLRSVGILGLIMLLYRSGVFQWFFALMRPVGQMAFTNYLTQSFMCGFIFYGIGLGMFGQLELYQIYYVVAGMWALQIAWSHIWLKYFQFGPLEWLWRSLTYWKLQPMRRSYNVERESVQNPSVVQPDVEKPTSFSQIH